MPQTLQDLKNKQKYGRNGQPSLLLNLDEVLDLVQRCSRNLLDKPSFTRKSVETIYKQANGHASAVMSLLVALVAVRHDLLQEVSKTDVIRSRKMKAAV